MQVTSPSLLPFPPPFFLRRASVSAFLSPPLSGRVSDRRLPHTVGDMSLFCSQVAPRSTATPPILQTVQVLQRPHVYLNTSNTVGVRVEEGEG